VFFLTVSEVLKLHELQLNRYGGSTGVRDLGLLESAVSQAQAGFGGVYLHEDLAAMAAAYLFSLVKNHPFVDGNKRAGLATALAFLDLRPWPSPRAGSIRKVWRRSFESCRARRLEGRGATRGGEPSGW
jgi:death-on-curing protein